MTNGLLKGFGLLAPGLSLGVGKTFCIPPPSVIPTGASVVELLNTAGARSLMSVPSILEEIALIPDGKGISALMPLDFVAFGGGLLKPIVGEKLAAAGVKLLNHYGTTETGPLTPIFVPKMDYDWRYFRLRTDMNLKLEPLPLLDNQVERYTLIARPFGWEKPFEIQDQLISNPCNPMIDFNAVGRSDDLIVLASGEKVLPHILETLLSEIEFIMTAVAFGEGRFELGVMVQPSSPLSPDQFDDFKSSIWPVVVEAGDRMDAHARVSSKEALIVVPPSTVFPRSDKGAIMRKEVYKLFEADIAKVYLDLENGVFESLRHPLSMSSLEQDLRCLIQMRLNWKVTAEDWDSDDDLFELGMDSLQAIQLRRFLLSSMPRSAHSPPVAECIGRDFVYHNPSVNRMVNAIRSFQDLHELRSTEHSSVREFVERYSLGSSDLCAASPDGAVVLLTGSTGSLGTFLLAHLASLPGVTRIFCLNRPKSDIASQFDPYVRQLNSAKSKRVSISEEAWSKIEIFQSDTALPFLGLEESQYARVREQVTHILHSAWPMDFKRRLPSFKRQFQTLKNLLSLARDAHVIHPLVRPRFFFISSIAAIGQYPLFQGERIVPEIPVSDERWTNSIGYAEAKLVCENILHRAALDHAEQIEVTYIRLGQMSGSSKSGVWNTDEHLAAMIKSSQLIGQFPKLEGVSFDEFLLKICIETIRRCYADLDADIVLDTSRLCGGDFGRSSLDH